MLGCTTPEIKAVFDKVCGDFALSYTGYKHWFKSGRTDIKDEFLPGRPPSAASDDVGVKAATDVDARWHVIEEIGHLMCGFNSL